MKQRLPAAVRRISKSLPERLGRIDRALRGDLETIAAFLRRSCAYRNRRTPWPAHAPRRIEESIAILRCSYNSNRPQRRRRRPLRSPVFSTPLSFPEFFTWMSPPGRPSRQSLRELPG